MPEWETPISTGYAKPNGLTWDSLPSLVSEQGKDMMGRGGTGRKKMDWVVGGISKVVLKTKLKKLYKKEISCVIYALKYNAMYNIWF